MRLVGFVTIVCLLAATLSVVLVSSRPPMEAAALVPRPKTSPPAIGAAGRAVLVRPREHEPGAPASDERLPVAVSPLPLEAKLQKRYAGWSALRMLQEGQVLQLRVVGAMREEAPPRASFEPDERTEPEAWALHCEALWLLEQGTLELRREAAEWERGRVARGR
jgi:hypothetical protein